MPRFTRAKLESEYRKYNKRRFVHPDPLEFLYRYDDPGDREVVALVASALAYGRVTQILKSVDRALGVMGSPRDFAVNASKAKLNRTFKGFKHRFTTGGELASLVHGAGRVISSHGSLGDCFGECVLDGESTVREALTRFAARLVKDGIHTSLIPDPAKGSACKRMNLMVRWMARSDSVDPGGWTKVDKSKLIVPLDTHMHRISLEHGLTRRKNADMRAALEITTGFSRFSPDDPVKYDFALTRPGIGGH